MSKRPLCQVFLGMILLSPSFVQAEEPLPFLVLNPKATVTPGTAYHIEKGRISSLAELLASRPLNESGGLTKKTEEPSSIIKSLGRSAISLPSTTPPYHQQSVSSLLTLESKATIVEQLGDPFDCLEILNRPVTGYAYNRDAELKIVQWRTSLGAAIYKASRDANPSSQVVICTSIESVATGTIVVSDIQSEEAAKEAVKMALAASSCRVDYDKVSMRMDGECIKYVFPLTSSIVISASFRELSLVDSSTQPRIEYKLNGTFALSAFLAPTPPVIQIQSSPCLSCATPQVRRVFGRR